MGDYAVRRSDDEEPPGPFVVGRGVRINYQVLDKRDGADEAGLDLSTARWVVRIRAYAASSSAATTRDEVCSNSTTNSATGFIDHYFSCGTTAYPTALRWELVLVDTATADADTKTGKCEYVLLQWKAPIEAAPRT